MFFYLGFFLSVSFWAVRSLGDVEQKSDFVRPYLISASERTDFCGSCDAKV